MLTVLSKCYYYKQANKFNKNKDLNKQINSTVLIRNASKDGSALVKQFLQEHMNTLMSIKKEKRTNLI